MSQETELHVVRHGQTEWNAAGRWQGHLDPPLSKLGRRQAADVAIRFAALQTELEDAGRRPLRQVLSSDLGRATETAEIIAAQLGVPVRPAEGLRELDVGEWAGLDRPAIEARDAALLMKFETGDPEIRPPGGETRAEIRTRARAAVEWIASEYRGDRIVVVTHLGIIRALLADAEPDNCEVEIFVAEELLARPIAADGRPRSGPL